jgi:hypothetical protein
MDELNNKRYLPLTNNNKVKDFFGNYNFDIQPQSTPSERFQTQAEEESNKYRFYTDLYKNLAPLGMIENYIKTIDRGMIKPPLLNPNQYSIPMSKGLLQYDPTRTQYSPAYTEKEKEQIKAYRELRNEMKQPEPTDEDEEHRLWRLGRDYT